MKQVWLLLKNLAFTLVVAGLLVAWVPFKWFERFPRWPRLWQWPQWVAVSIFAAGALAWLSAQWFFAMRGQGTPAPFDPPKKFVRRGPYKWVRNPMYLGLGAMVGSEVLFFWSGHIGIYFVCLVCFLHLYVVLFEENSMRFKFGAMYEDYKREVPRWLPRKPRPILQTVAPFEVKR